jgi:signal transduction histidine kinase
VRAMKEFSHPGGGEKTLVDLNHAIESTLTVSRNEWKYIADLKTDFDPDLPQISCYPSELNQAFLNIIVNASHAIIHANAGKNEKGLITIATQKDGDNIVIRIEDTGGGIPESIQNKIFDPFFTTKDVGKGTGQGLAIARSVIVDKHGGTIEFKSEIGVGTTFNIKLPISTDSVRKSEIA